MIGGLVRLARFGKTARRGSFQVSDTRIFPQFRKHFVKTFVRRLPTISGELSGGMKQKEAKPLLMAAWDAWLQKKGISHNDATGRDALQFYYELQDTKSPLLGFISRARDKWDVVYDWLVSEGRVGL
jgi:hypothetical protein